MVCFVVAAYSLGIYSLPVQAAADSDVYFSPATDSVDIDTDFTLDAMIDPGLNDVTAVEVHITFDQAKFRLDGISTTGSPFSVTLQAASISNTNGTASITVGVPASNPAVPVTAVAKIATFSFHSLGVVSNSSIAFPTSTVASAIGEAGNVVATRTSAAITVTSTDVTAPIIAAVTPVATPTNDTTPSYIFSSDEAGTITYGGDCSSSTTSAVSGNNTVTFSSLSAGAHSNCTIQVTDASTNASNILSVAAFTIDTTVPTVQNISSDKTNDTYGVGEVIDIDVTFSEAVTSTGNVTVTLETGTTDRSCVFTVSNATTGTCNYTVQDGDLSSDLTVSAISGAISDQAGNAMSNFTPTTNLAANKALVISAVAPVLSDGAPSSPLPLGTTETNLTLTTDENATCKYSTTAGTAYASMTGTFDTTGSTSHSTAISGLTDGTTYHYYVRCQDSLSNANTSDYAIVFSVSDMDAPTVPDSLSGSAGSSSKISLSWTASTDPNLVGYKIYRNGNPIATTISTSYTDSGLKQSNTYNYTVTAYDSYGNESAAAAVSVKTQKSSSSSSSSSSKKKSSGSRKLGNYPKEVKFGGILIQYGKKFSKNSQVALYFQKSGGGYYPPKIVNTDKEGNFSISYPAFKPRGTYSWYAVNLKTGTKSKTMKYKIK